MFLVQAIFSISVIYWFSALIAEVVMTSKVERSLAPAIRVGIGFLISIIYFSAAWLLMSIQQVWILGIILLFTYSYSCGQFTNIQSKTREFISVYFKSFLLCCLGACFFFAPLFIANNFGPFTEGGGDISIYADTAKFLQDKHLTGLGHPVQNFSETLASIRDLITQAVSHFYDGKIKYDPILHNPPAAEYANYRLTLLNNMNPLIYAPYAAYGLLASQTNYVVYFAIQAFFFYCMLAGIWYFFLQFSRSVACFATLLIMCSHGIISVFYNGYAMQAASLAIASLIVVILPTIRPMSWAGLRIYGALFLPLWIAYFHYLSIVLPLVFVCSIFNWNKQYSESHLANINFSWLQKSIVIIFLVAYFLLFLIGLYPSILFVKAILMHHAEEANEFFGSAISMVSLKWLSFLFGYLSQQHYYPFSVEYRFTDIMIAIGSVASLIALVLGAMVMWRIYASPSLLRSNKRFNLLIYIAIIFTIILHLYLARSSLYTQAKGTQNVLIFFYLLLALPIGMATIALKEGVLSKRLVRGLWIASIIFLISLANVKILYTIKLAFCHDRGSILEQSYFSQAKVIRQEDPYAFILFEPRKSADLYMSTQPFYGLRLMPTRHLIVQTERFDDSQKKWHKWVYRPVLASDLIEHKDLSHLWTLKAICNANDKLPISNCEWKAERLIKKIKPSLLIFADIYEQGLKIDQKTNDTKEASTHSFLRNGSAMIFLPHQEGDVKVKVMMQPRDLSAYPQLSKEIRTRVKKGEFGNNVKITETRQSIILHFKFSETNRSDLKLVARYSGEYWLNVMINNQALNE